MEWIKTGNYPSVPVTAVVLDFDGTSPHCVKDGKQLWSPLCWK